jgi:hypothetical protein
MGLFRRKDAHKDESAVSPLPGAPAPSRLRIKIEGPDAERLAALLDMPAVVERLREQGVDPDDAGRDRSGPSATADQDPEARR